MKKISILAVAALAMFSCSKNVNVDGPATDNDQISFKPAITGMQKGSYTSMNNDDNTVVAIDGDEFGVFMVVDETTPATANNIKATYKDGIFTGYADPTLTWADLIAGTQTSLDFYSYYPYSATATDVENITVTVPSTQTMGTKESDGSYKLANQRTVTKNDFIFSKNISDAGANKTIGFGQSDVPADRTVRFEYSHALAMLEFNILQSEAMTDVCYFESLTLSGDQIYTDGTINLTDANPKITAGTTGTLTIAPAKSGQAADKLVSEPKKTTSTVIYQMLAVPMEAASLTDTNVELSIKKGSSTGTKFTTSLGENAKWEAGKRYKYNLVVSENTIRVELVKIDDWVDGGEVNIPATPVA